MKKATMCFALILACILPSHAAVKSWCFLCNCFWCEHSLNLNGYPDGGDCVCIQNGHMCTSTGICKTYTTDPNHDKDCPYGLNAKCCSSPYDCGGTCTASAAEEYLQSLNSDPHAPIYLYQKLTLTLPELDKIISEIDARDVIRVNPSEHQWIGSATFLDQIAKLSPEMAELLRLKRKQLDERFGWSSPSRSRQRGGFETAEGKHIKYEILRHGSQWTFKSAIEPQTKGQEIPASEINTLVIDGTSWTLSHGEVAIGTGKVE